MNRFPDTFQTVTDWMELVWPKCPSQYGHANEMVDKFRLHCTGTKLIDSLVHGAPNDYERNSQHSESDLSATGTTDPTQHRLSLEFLAVDGDETPPEEWEAEDDWTHVRSKLVVKKEIQYLWDVEVYGYSTEAEARAQTGRNPVGLKWVDTSKGSAEAPRYPSRLVCTEVRHKGVEPIFSVTPLRLKLCWFYSVLRVRNTFVELKSRFLISIADMSRAHILCGCGA